MCPRLDCSGHLLRSVTSSDETESSLSPRATFPTHLLPPRADREIFSRRCIFQRVTIDKLISTRVSVSSPAARMGGGGGEAKVTVHLLTRTDGNWTRTTRVVLFRSKC